MDGTLIRERSSWNLIHRHFGTTRPAKRALRLYLQGEIDYAEFMRRDIAVWPKPLHIREVKRLLESYMLRRNARSTVNELIRLGVQAAIVTAGLDLLASRVASTLGIRHVAANGLGTDSKGFLTGEGMMQVDPLRKEAALTKMADSLGVGLEECVSVGDSRFDSGFLRATGLGLLLGSRRLASEIGVRHISSLPEILTLI